MLVVTQALLSGIIIDVSCQEMKLSLGDVGLDSDSVRLGRVLEIQRHRPLNRHAELPDNLTFALMRGSANSI